MAFHQPLVPVFPVARELFSKTKLIPSKNTSQNDSRPSSKKFVLRGKKNVADATIRDYTPRTRGSVPGGALAFSNSLTGMTLVDEPETAELDPQEQEDLGRKRQRRPRLLSMFVRGKNETRSVSLPSVSSFSPTSSLPLTWLSSRGDSQEIPHEARLLTRRRLMVND